MFKLNISTVLLIFINILISQQKKEEFTIGEIFDAIDNEKMKRLNFIEKRQYFLSVLSEHDNLRKLAFKESHDLGFETHYPLMINDFPCKNYSIPGSGEDINKLTPSDINVIAALGDSLSAGLGLDARSIFGVLWENRGKVFDIGGNRNAQTLPNLFRVYNPNVKGMSTKTTFIRNKGDELNVAVSGDTSADLMNQLNNLLKRMRNDKSINMDKDWKMISIFIGNNDICRSCESGKAKDFTAQLLKDRIEAVLDKLKAEVPKTFVNLVTMLDVFRVHQLNIGLICTALHLYECPCVAFSKNITKIIEVNTEFQTAISEISDQDKYNDKDDFTVVTQPFFENTFVPVINDEPDLSYFAPDCFHLSGKGHAQVALSLWNSLFEPIPLKKRHWHVGEKFECPTKERPFFATKNNSV